MNESSSWKTSASYKFRSSMSFTLRPAPKMAEVEVKSRCAICYVLYYDFAQIELSLEKSEGEKRWNLFRLCQPGTAVP